MELGPRIFTGKVYHKRFAPKEHSLRNRIFYIRFSLSQIHQLKSPLFSINRFNLLSFYDKDHGARDGSDLWTWAREQLKKSQIFEPIQEIEIQTMPRVLGYVFNPVSFWYCYDKNQELIAIIAEVNNTFGSTHSYVLRPSESVKSKVLHVSPFFVVEGQYHFRFLDNFVSLDYYVGNERKLTASLQGSPLAWTTKNLFWVWITHPLMTFSAIFFIHWHALLLILKSVPFYGKSPQGQGGSHV